MSSQTFEYKTKISDSKVEREKHQAPSLSEKLISINSWDNQGNRGLKNPLIHKGNISSSSEEKYKHSYDDTDTVDTLSSKLKIQKRFEVNSKKSIFTGSKFGGSRQNGINSLASLGNGSPLKFKQKNNFKTSVFSPRKQQKKNNKFSTFTASKPLFSQRFNSQAMGDISSPIEIINNDDGVKIMDHQSKKISAFDLGTKNPELPKKRNYGLKNSSSNALCESFGSLDGQEPSHTFLLAKKESQNDQLSNQSILTQPISEQEEQELGNSKKKNCEEKGLGSILDNEFKQFGEKKAVMMKKLHKKVLSKMKETWEEEDTSKSFNGNTLFKIPAKSTTFTDYCTFRNTQALYTEAATQIVSKASKNIE